MPDPSLISGPACFLYATRIDAYETTDATYHLLFLSVIRDDENADNVGLSMIVFVSDELYQTEDFYWEYGNREPGIYIDKLDE